jgi:hypothetical protein
VVEHRRDKRRVEEIEIGEREEEEEEEEEEDDERDDDEHGEEPQTRLNGAIRNKETIILMQRKVNEHKMTSKGQKAISSAEQVLSPKPPCISNARLYPSCSSLPTPETLWSNNLRHYRALMERKLSGATC